MTNSNKNIGANYPFENPRVFMKIFVETEDFCESPVIFMRTRAKNRVLWKSCENSYENLTGFAKTLVKTLEYLFKKPWDFHENPCENLGLLPKAVKTLEFS